jgi:hypothetical protein
LPIAFIAVTLGHVVIGIAGAVLILTASRTSSAATT